MLPKQLQNDIFNFHFKEATKKVYYIATGGGGVETCYYYVVSCMLHADSM